MRVVGRQELFEFAKKHPDVRGAVQAWIVETEQADWASPQEVRDRYRTASLVRDNGIVFNLAGNKYRLYVKVVFSVKVVRVIRVGKHSDYDAWKL